MGSQTNVDEEGLDAKEPRRAAILEVDPDGRSGERIFASGLRNPNGMDWVPGTRILWTVVNERDELGDDLVPDYLTSVREGAFYTVLPDGSLLVADDGGNVVWRVTYIGSGTTASR